MEIILNDGANIHIDEQNIESVHCCCTKAQLNPDFCEGFIIINNKIIIDIATINWVKTSHILLNGCIEQIQYFANRIIDGDEKPITDLIQFIKDCKEHDKKRITFSKIKINKNE